MVFVAKGKYNEAVEKYDWGKLNLANIIKVNEISSEVNTVVIFKTKTKKIKQKNLIKNVALLENITKTNRG